MRQRLTLIALVIFTLGIPVIVYGKKIFNHGFINEVLIDPLAYGDERIGPDADFPLAFPYELPWSVWKYYQARRVVRSVLSDMKESPTKELLVLSEGSPEVFVLVIGESSSRRAWHAFNSNIVNTTPNISKLRYIDNGLILFSDVAAIAAYTRQTVPSLVSSKPILTADGKVNKEPSRSIVHLAALAGYHTAWLSNQVAVGRHDGVIAAYAQDAHDRGFFNPSQYSGRGTLDSVLLQPLLRKLNDNKKVFVVLHTMGSHFKFSHRYPEGFGPFPYSKTINEEYYNSISYTDYFLNEIITSLKKDQRSSVLMYVSDHGQSLPGECERPDINRMNLSSYEVPALVWLSEKYIENNPDIFHLLRNSSSRPYTNADAYQTIKVLMMGLVDSKDNTSQTIFFGGGARGKRMIFAPGGKFLNYDEVRKNGECF